MPDAAEQVSGSTGTALRNTLAAGATADRLAAPARQGGDPSDVRDTGAAPSRH